MIAIDEMSEVQRVPVSPTSPAHKLQPAVPLDVLNMKAAILGEKEFDKTRSKNRHLVRYILLELEKAHSNNSFDRDFTGVNIEHVLPQNSGDGWSEFSDEEYEQLIFRLGNMTLMDAQVNRDVGNDGYQAKVKAYKESAFQITKSIPERYAVWSRKDWRNLPSVIGKCRK